MAIPFVFISYRRDDAAGTAGRIGDGLEQKYGKRRVFRDISIQPTEDFRKVIGSKLDQCNILLAVMGRSWADDVNLKRLGDEKKEDFVRIEIASALDRGIPVLAVLIDGTPVPAKDRLPKKLQPVVNKQKVDLRNFYYSRDFQTLVEAIENAVEEPPGRLAPDGMRYQEIPAGTFHLGAVPRDADAGDDEKPRHQVRISEPFHLTVTPVTVEAYEHFVGHADIELEMPAPPRFNPGWRHNNQPIIRVTWDQAQRYCTWAGGRLPTEAEWERAARGHRKGLKFPYGKALSRKQAVWYQQGKTPRWHPEPAGNWRMNDFGLVHMVGNVWEWVADWYDPGEYKRQADRVPCVDPRGPATSPLDQRVVRGGSYADRLAAQRISNRRGLEPDTSSRKVGFRCVLDEWPT